MRRTATSLVEVLIAIFVMALGLIALLTLFPVGASQMSKAIQNERAAQVAASAASYFRMQWKATCEQELAQMKGPNMFRIDISDPNIATNPALQAQLQSRLQNFVFALDDPNAGNTQFQIASMSTSPYLPSVTGVSPPTRAASGTGMSFLTQASANINKHAAVSNRSSFPVMVDPVGWVAGSEGQTMASWWFGPNAPGSGGTATTAIPRRTLSQFLVKTPPARSEVIRNFFLLDDMTFEKDGSARVSNSLLERAGQYSYSFLIRRNVNCNRSEVNLWVVVYSRRSIDSESPEPAFNATFTLAPPPTGETRPVMPDMITMSYDSEENKPDLRRGSWILDANYLEPTTNTPAFQGYYYRVNELSEPRRNGSGWEIDIYLDSRLRPGNEPSTAVSSSRLFIIPSGVLDVFDKGLVDMVSPNRTN